jgi:thiosulfate dehydrogenase [quinone] large subunit
VENYQRALGIETEVFNIRSSFFSAKMSATAEAASLPSGQISGGNITLPRTVPRALLVIPRIYVGSILFIADLGKLTRENPFADEMLRFLRGVTTRRASAPYLHFVQQIVIPHASLFSYLVMTGEAVAALSLLTGTLTRLGAAVAMLLFLNYMLAEGRTFWSPDSEDAALIMIGLTLFLGRAGRAWGIDSYLARGWPRSPLW